jgi:thiosulfate dehydrogenase [quinone] large subunit
MQRNYTNTQLTLLVILRVFIGWHFLYEGLSKLMNPNWTAQSYLLDSAGLFKGFFEWMATNPNVIGVVDFINIWGLVLIGLGLMLGCLSRIATVSGIVLLSLYYLSHPALIGANYATPTEGSYLFVNKILIELAAMLVLAAFPTGKDIGLDRFVCRFFNKKNN